MLDNLQTLITAIKTYDFGNEMEKVIVDNKDALADLQAEQWAKGQDIYGKPIQPGYAPFTIEKKKKNTGLAAVTDHVTHFETGELYRSLEGKVQNKEYSIESPSFKLKAVEKRSDTNVVGLTDESKERFAEEITIPGVRKSFKAATGLSF